MKTIKSKLLQYTEHKLLHQPSFKRGLRLAEVHIKRPEYCTRAKADIQLCFKADACKRSFYFRTKKKCESCKSDYNLDNIDCFKCIALEA